MCGIVGWLNFQDDRTPLSERIETMARALAHRGPDDQGVQILDHVGLGHRRLSILDLSAQGHQPMSDATGTLWITFNGEIYNYRALKEKQEAAGLVFHSGTDTEVLLNAYAQQLETFLQILDGMFALAIYDSASKRLIIARDTAGEKPFYYAHQPGHYFAFASEPKALLTQPELTVAPETQALVSYLHLGFIPSPHSPYSGIMTLPAGHWAVLDTQSGQWILPPTPFHKQRVPQSRVSRSSVNLPDCFDALLQQSVLDRCHADVPVGLLLSGGLDSTVVGWMARHGLGETTPIKSFSVSFDVPDLDEGPKARLAAQWLGTEHHEIRCGAQDFLNVLPQVLKGLDTPVAEHFIPMSMVCGLAKQHVKVALTGDGADELLGGYHATQNVARFRQVSDWPGLRSVAQLFVALAQQVIPDPTLCRKLSRIEAMLQAPPEMAYLAYRYAHMPARLVPKIFLPDAMARWQNNESLYTLLKHSGLMPEEGLKSVDGFLTFDFKTSLPEAILLKSDRMSMAHGLELRTPFFQPALCEFLSTLPEEWKHRGANPRGSKWILRDFLRRHGAPETLWNQGKSGFSAPFGHWLRHEKAFYQAIAQQLLDGVETVPSLGLSSHGIQCLLQDHVAGRTDAGTALWNLLVLVSWFQQYGQLSFPQPGARLCSV